MDFAQCRNSETLRDILLPEHVDISVGSFLTEDFDYLNILDEVSEALNAFTTSRSKRDETGHPVGRLLDFAFQLLERGAVEFFAYAAIIGTYVSLGSQRDIFAGKINALFDKMDKQFVAAYRDARGEEGEIIDSAEFEAYYCAARMLHFEETPLSRRMHGRVNQMLRDLITDERNDHYCDLVVNSVIAISKSKHPERYPSAETILWMGLVE